MKKNVAGRIADTVGIAIFVVGLVIIYLGEKTDYFKWVNDEHGGVEFLRTRMDFPFYDLISSILPGKKEDLYFILTAVLIHGLVSGFYGFIGYLFGRLFSRS